MSLIEDIQHNCNISDAKDHGIYSMCTMVLKLRNLYKWEHGMEPWEEPESADLLDWIEEKENSWENLAHLEYKDLKYNGSSYSPSSVNRINALFETENLQYGAGHGRSWKAVFFLAETIKEYSVDGISVHLLGAEKAKEMASPFAMAQDGRIIIRRDSLRFFLWDQVQELRSSCRTSFQHALNEYGVLTDGKLDQTKFKERFDAIVDGELNLFVYHEIGELQQQVLDSATLEKVITRFPASVIELVCRTIKDVLADTHDNGLLAYCIREKKETSLSFYIGFLDGLRKMMFPEIFTAWDEFLNSKDWSLIEDARLSCQKKNNELAEKVRLISDHIDTLPDEDVKEMFLHDVIDPLGLDIPHGATGEGEA